MIVKQKRTIETPIIGQPYQGKHGESVVVYAIRSSQYGKQGWWVDYFVGGHEMQTMELERFMKWATESKGA